jgi:WD40 repeat protein
VVRIDKGRGGLLFSPDGRRLAAPGCCRPGSKIEVWDARSGERELSATVDGYATTIAFSPDGGLLGAGTESGKVVLLNADNGEQVGQPMEVATARIDPISFSPDGRLLAASSEDQTATLWDLESRKRLGKSFPEVQGVVPVTQFAPDGDLVIAYLADAVKWPMDPRTWERFACRVAGRDLTAEEWNDVLPDRPYRQVCP